MKHLSHSIAEFISSRQDNIKYKIKIENAPLVSMETMKIKKLLLIKQYQDMASKSTVS